MAECFERAGWELTRLADPQPLIGSPSSSTSRTNRQPASPFTWGCPFTRSICNSDWRQVDGYTMPPPSRNCANRPEAPRTLRPILNVEGRIQSSQAPSPADLPLELPSRTSLFRDLRGSA
jgi:hypothetical protein